MKAVQEKIVVVHCGTRHIHEIVNSMERLGVYVEVVPKDVNAGRIRRYKREGSLKGIVISGMIYGSPSVYDAHTIQPDPRILELGVPVLGICYGHQYIAYVTGGKVERARESEIGLRNLYVHNEGKLLERVGNGIAVKLKHSDIVTSVPGGFDVLASTDVSPIAAYECRELGLYGTQFHPEKVETRRGKKILRNFLFEIAGCINGNGKLAGNFESTRCVEIRPAECCEPDAHHEGSREALLGEWERLPQAMDALSVRPVKP